MKLRWVRFWQSKFERVYWYLVGITYSSLVALKKNNDFGYWIDIGYAIERKNDDDDDDDDDELPTRVLVLCTCTVQYRYVIA